MQQDQLSADTRPRFVALLSVGASAPEWPGAVEPPAPVRLGFHLPVEHQARQAIAVGVTQIVVHVEAPGADLMRTLDRLSRESGVAVTCASDGPALSRQLRADDRVLLIANAMILPQQALDDLTRTDPPALLCVPNVPACAHLERIDADHVWAGAALLPAGLVLGTLDMLGEWDLILTLLRRAIQVNARRIELSAELAVSDRLARIGDQAAADRALEVLAAGAAADVDRDLLSALLAPLRCRCVAALARRQVNPAHLSLGAAVLALAAIATVSLHSSVVAVVMALVAEGALGVGTASARLMLHKGPANWLRILVKGSGLTVLAIIGGRLTGGSALALCGVFLPLAWLAVTTMAEARTADVPPRGGRWIRLTGGMALLLALVGLLFDRAEVFFVLLALSAFGTAAVPLLAARDNRI